MVSFETIKDFCKNKEIIIVGNSGNLLKYKKGELIDSYDIVVRMGQGYPRPEYYESVGQRTSIWLTAYKNHNQMEKHYSFFKSKYIIRNCFKQIPRSLKPISYFIEDKYINEIHKKISSRPTTGFVAIFLFLMISKNLDITGYDFFKCKQNFYENRLRKHKAKSHRPELEKPVIEDLINKKIIRTV